MERRTAEQTRELLLDLGVEMLHERGVTVGVAHIRLKDVLARANLTTGAAYRLWDNQADFHRELAVAAARFRDGNPIASTVVAIRHLVDEGAPLSEVIRVATRAHVDGFSGPDGEGLASTTFLTTLALRATASHHPDVQAASRARHDESIETFAALYQALLHVYRRRMRPPFTLEHLTTAVAAIGEGFALQAIEGAAHPIVFLDDDVEWTLMGATVVPLVEALTEPIDGPANDPGAEPEDEQKGEPAG